jgi:hypothetical protein
MANPDPPDGTIWSLPLPYGVWAITIFLLYFACRWYADGKARRPDGGCVTSERGIPPTGRALWLPGILRPSLTFTRISEIFRVPYEYDFAQTVGFGRHRKIYPSNCRKTGARFDLFMNGPRSWY